jgi:hypothetical protein
VHSSVAASADSRHGDAARSVMRQGIFSSRFRNGRDSPVDSPTFRKIGEKWGTRAQITSYGFLRAVRRRGSCGQFRERQASVQRGAWTRGSENSYRKIGPRTAATELERLSSQLILQIPGRRWRERPNAPAGRQRRHRRGRSGILARGNELNLIAIRGLCNRDGFELPSAVSASAGKGEIRGDEKGEQERGFRHRIPLPLMIPRRLERLLAPEIRRIKIPILTSQRAQR